MILVIELIILSKIIIQRQIINISNLILIIIQIKKVLLMEIIKIILIIK